MTGYCTHAHSLKSVWPANLIIMKNLAVVALCVTFAVVVSARPEEEKYTDQYDNVDVDEILKSDRLRTNYFNCLKTGKKCTKEGQTLRDILPDALKTACSKCTEVQRKQSDKVLRFMIKEHPEEFLELEKVFDPQREYRTKYADRLKADGIVLPN